MRRRPSLRSRAAIRLRRRRLSLRIAAERAPWLGSERLTGGLDAPLPGSVSGDRLLVEGWAHAGRRPPVAVAVSLDGRVCGTAEIGVRRPDVAAVHPRLPGAERSGFRTHVDLARVSAESVVVRVDAIRSDGRLEPLAEARVRLARNPAVDEVIGEIEGPSPDVVQPRDWVWVTGWALSTGELESEVEVRLGGEPAGRARLGIARPELVERVGLPEAGISGWSRMIDLSQIDPATDRVTVGAVARRGDEEWRLGELPLVLAPGPAAGSKPGVSADPGASSLQLAARSANGAGNGGPPSGPRRMLCFTHNLQIGGAQLYLLELLRHLTDRGNLSATLVAPADGPLREGFERAGVCVHLTRPYAVTTATAYEHQQDELEAWARPRGYDCALINTLPAFPGADLALRRLGLPTAWAIHESYPLGAFWAGGYPVGGVDPQVTAHAERALAGASAVVFEAEATRRQYLAAGEHERMVTLPFGIDLDPIDAYREELDRGRVRGRLELAEGARVILCLGTTEPRKCQTVLARAFAAVAADHPDTVLAFVGADDSEYCAALGDYVRGVGLADRVRIEPVARDPRDWLAVSELLVCPSDLESLPRVVLEAMAFELPVLASAIFGIPEMIDDGANGFLFGPGDPAGLARALDRVLRLDRRERAEVGIAAAETIRRRHDASRYAASFGRLLDGLRTAHGPQPREAITA